MPAQADLLLGRKAELGQVAEFLEAEAPAALVLEGEAGMLVAGSTVSGHDVSDFTLGNAGVGGASAPGGHPGGTGKRAFAAYG